MYISPSDIYSLLELSDKQYMYTSPSKQYMYISPSDIYSLLELSDTQPSKSHGE